MSHWTPIASPNYALERGASGTRRWHALHHGDAVDMEHEERTGHSDNMLANWRSLASEPAFRDHCSYLGTRALDALVETSNKRFGGAYARENPGAVFAGAGVASDNHSKLCDQKVDQALLDELHVATPDHLVLSMLGTAYPYFAAHADPSKSKIRLERDGRRIVWLANIYDWRNRGMGMVRWCTPGEEQHQDLLFLAKHTQGQGLAAAMYGAQEAYALHVGIPKMTMLANLEVGAYAWSQLGFDFQEDYDRKRALQGFHKELQHLHETGYLDADQEIAVYRNLLGLKHSWEFANYQIPHEIAPSLPKEIVDFGKHMFIGRDGKTGIFAYRAVKHLDDPLSHQVALDTLKAREARQKRS